MDGGRSRGEPGISAWRTDLRPAHLREAPRVDLARGCYRGPLWVLPPPGRGLYCEASGPVPQGLFELAWPRVPVL